MINFPQNILLYTNKIVIIFARKFFKYCQVNLQNPSSSVIIHETGFHEDYGRKARPKLNFATGKKKNQLPASKRKLSVTLDDFSILFYNIERNEKSGTRNT